MSGIATAVLGGGIISGVLGSKSQKDAANIASDAQVEATQLGVDEQRRQFDKMQEVLAPYMEGQTGALSGLLATSGLSGPEAMQEQIDRIRNGPEFQALNEVGEEAILANASATGGLRGGNTQTALGRFRQQNLSDLINKQMSRFGGIAQMGQNAAAGVGSGAVNMGNNVSQMFMNQGEAIGSAAIARGNANAGMWGNIGGAFGTVAGLSDPSKGFGRF